MDELANELGMIDVHEASSTVSKTAAPVPIPSPHDDAHPENDQYDSPSTAAGHLDTHLFSSAQLISGYGPLDHMIDNNAKKSSKIQSGSPEEKKSDELQHIPHDDEYRLSASTQSSSTVVITEPSCGALDANHQGIFTGGEASAEGDGSGYHEVLPKPNKRYNKISRVPIFAGSTVVPNVTRERHDSTVGAAPIQSRSAYNRPPALTAQKLCIVTDDQRMDTSGYRETPISLSSTVTAETCLESCGRSHPNKHSTSGTPSSLSSAVRKGRIGKPVTRSASILLRSKVLILSDSESEEEENSQSNPADDDDNNSQRNNNNSNSCQTRCRSVNSLNRKKSKQKRSTKKMDVTSSTGSFGAGVEYTQHHHAPHHHNHAKQLGTNHSSPAGAFGSGTSGNLNQQQIFGKRKRSTTTSFSHSGESVHHHHSSASSTGITSDTHHHHHHSHSGNKMDISTGEPGEKSLNDMECDSYDSSSLSESSVNSEYEQTFDEADDEQSDFYEVMSHTGPVASNSSPAGEGFAAGTSSSMLTASGASSLSPMVTRSHHHKHSSHHHHHQYHHHSTLR